MEGDQIRTRRPLNLIHTSDVHLGADLGGAAGERHRAAARAALSEVISIANERAADMLLLVGDLFDSSRIGSDEVEFALREIARAQMPFVLAPGNHDAHDERSIYAELADGDRPPNLYMTLRPEGESLDFAGLETRVWGRALIEHSPDFRPLKGIPGASADRWNIALAHGLFTEDEGSERASRIIPAEISASGYDYIALGHVHVFRDVSQGKTRAFYCGSPSPININDGAGSVAWVIFNPTDSVHVRLIPIKP